MLLRRLGAIGSAINAFSSKKHWVMASAALVSMMSVLFSGTVLSQAPAPQSSSSGPALSGEKLVIQQRHQQRYQESLAIPMQEPNWPDDGEPFARVIPGIHNTAENPFPRGSYVTTNMWQEVADGKLKQIWAATPVANESAGLLILTITEPTHGEDEEVSRHPLPISNAGVPRLLTAVGRTLTVQTSLGLTFAFNVDSRTYV